MSATDYVRAHRAVTKERGPATDHACVDCGGPALQWSYDGKDPDPRYLGVTAYSHDTSRYQPRCRKCHLEFDRDEEMIARRAKACGDGMKRRLAEPGGRDVFNEAGKKAARKRRECSCGRVMSPGSLAVHQKASNHKGWKDIR